MRGLRHLATGSALATFALLAGCGGDSPTPTTAAPVAGPVTGSSAPPNPTGANLNVSRCLSQELAPGVTVASLVVPDTVTIRLGQASGFPNGRRLEDPVIDLTLAVLFLDLTKHPADTLAKIPLNPPANDVPFRSAFPYLAAAQGSPPLSATTGTNFNFRTDPASAYTRVDRMGMPAVATVLISSATKTQYNDATPLDDTNFKFLSDINATLTGLTNALSTDLRTAGLSLCATPN